MKITQTILISLLFAFFLGAAEDSVDYKVINSIKQEAFQNGKVMEHLFYLTDVNGPRLTGSPEFEAAASWVVSELKKWGIANARLEPWGKFGRSWSLRYFSAHMIQPKYMPILGYPKAWCAPTSGNVQADVVYAPFWNTWEDSQRSDPTKVVERARKYASEQKGKLRGKIVLMEPLRELAEVTEAPSHRYTEKELADLEKAPEPVPLVSYEWPVLRLPDDPEERSKFRNSFPLEVEADFWERQEQAFNEVNAFLRDEGAAGVFFSDSRGIGGNFFVEEAASWHTGAPIPPASLVLEPEQYSRMVRLTKKHIPVRIQMEVRIETQEGPVEGKNVIAEIPGGKKKDELVMLGGHLDSWHSGTGATDNAAGCAVAMEAMRILKTLKLQMDRTVRLGLWSGEEQALYGSRAYVKEHFGDAVTMSLKPDHAKFAGYFNVDNGTGKIRGVYLQGNDMMRPIFERWFQPFSDLGVSSITIRDTSGTDHLSFDAVGLPGFQFIQDDVDYETRTHHSNLDVYDHARPADLMQASAILASIVYHTANRSDLLPRKPLPKPPPPKKPLNQPPFVDY